MTSLSPSEFEKLGIFYLGKRTDDQPVLYESRDLLTHAVCVGMTGSGKTGLCIGLLEEAAIDGVPAIVLDPKGDIANLLLTFPDLDATSFEPWVDPDQAERRGISTTELATAEADKWKKGLAKWGQDGERIARLRETADMTIYTPGSSAAAGVSLLSSLDAPPEGVLADADLLAERVSSTSSSLLTLLDGDADPLQSTEHILLSNLLLHRWEQGQGFDLAELIGEIIEPSIEKIGFVDVETFMSKKERTALAMRLNNLAAAPSFAAWLEGDPLDIDGFLRTTDGKPRISIFSIAHLQDSERMFFVSLLLGRLVGWVRSQPGTSSLRGLLYMDEIFGYLPPVAEPPSKKPLMTLLKQARAFGFGVVLATQNPADIDYKALSNTGTWFLGRLQTERDKARVLDGLDSGSGNLDKKALENTLSDLPGRSFVLHNVHDDEGPYVFRTRWVLSYLRGPLTRDDLRRLHEQRHPAEPTADHEPVDDFATPPTPIIEATPPVAPEPVEVRPEPEREDDLPDLDARIEQRYLAPETARPEDAGVLYRPMVYAAANVSIVDRRSGFDEQRRKLLLVGLRDELPHASWDRAFEVTWEPDDLQPDPAIPGEHHVLPHAATVSTAWTRWKKDLAQRLYDQERAALPTCPTLKLEAGAHETPRQFAARVQQELREKRDAALDKASERAEKRLQRARQKVERAEKRVSRETSQARSSQIDAAMSVGSTLLSAFMGRRVLRKGRSSTRRIGRSIDQQRDVSEAEAARASAVAEMQALEAQLKAELAAVAHEFSPQAHPIEHKELRPRRNDIEVELVALLWVPYWVTATGEKVRAVR